MMPSNEPVTVLDEGPTGTFQSRYPIPDGCNGRKILSAFGKLKNVPMPIKLSDAALFPLTPLEKGFVLGALAEYHARHA